MSHIDNNLPIGVFDSGIGGLTVLRALQQELPNESFIYLGDTARLPYGIKSPDTVTRYARQAAEIIYRQGVKMLVVACNTASALAIHHLQETFHQIPVISVIGPGAEAACNSSKSGEIMVIATESTVRHQAYENMITALRPNAKVYSQSCSLFVALAEEGWVEGPVAEAVVKEYLIPLFSSPNTQNIDCLVLGCTHFPVLAQTIKKIVPPHIEIVDSAYTTAKEVSRLLINNHWMKNADFYNPTIRFLATDAPERFTRVAQYFLGKTLENGQVELVDL